MPGRACRGLATARRCRLPPPPPLSRVNPAARIHLLPVQQVTGAPLVIQLVGQLGHRLPVPAVPAPEQPQGQHEVHHRPRGQEQAPLLPCPGRVHRGVHQLRGENPGQDTDRDPVRQPAIRRQPFRTIMRHKTVTIPRQTLTQGHWRQRRALPWEARPAHTRPPPAGAQIKMAQTNTGLVKHEAIFLTPDCPSRGHRVNGGPPGQISGRLGPAPVLTWADMHGVLC